MSNIIVSENLRKKRENNFLMNFPLKDVLGMEFIGYEGQMKEMKRNERNERNSADRA